jgi:hypothetical protein
MTAGKINRKKVSVLLRHHVTFFVLLLTGLLGLTPTVHADSQANVLVGEFSESRLDGWTAKKFENTTQYELTRIDNRIALKAVSRNSASGLVKKVQVDLEKTPFLNWQWRIENRLTGAFDETAKQGDDYAARIYVIVSGGIAFWKTRALNYVWARHARKEAVWHNAYAGKNAVMTAVRAKDDPISVWQMEKRNIKADLKTFFKEDIRYIDAVALMSDTDDTQNAVIAVYGDIYFSSN